jgi:hypothetical protein
MSLSLMEWFARSDTAASHWTSRPEMERTIVAFHVAIIPANQTTLNNAPLSPSGL